MATAGNCMYRCGICRKILLEPQQNRLCGHRFCLLCVQRVRLKYCQVCRSESLTPVRMSVFPDMGAVRDMQGEAGVCSHPGCVWQGSYARMRSHEESCRLGDTRMRSHEKSCHQGDTLIPGSMALLLNSMWKNTGFGPEEESGPTKEAMWEKICSLAESLDEKEKELQRQRRENKNLQERKQKLEKLCDSLDIRTKLA